MTTVLAQDATMRIDPGNSWVHIRLAVVCCAVFLFTAAPAAAQPSGVQPSPVGQSGKTASAAEGKDTASQSDEKSANDSTPTYVTESLRGRIVWLDEALKRRFGIETDADAKQTVAALETPDGSLYPLVKDDRGRGFWLDPRLHGVDMELRVRRFHGSPVVQVIRVYTLEDGNKYELDYWCDICAIPMYELKPCECCQGPIRFRRRLVDQDSTAPESTQQGDSDVGDAGR